jgi:signal peptidase I
MSERSPSGNFFTRWRKRRRALREARHLLAESRRILRRYGYRIKEEVAQEVKEARDGLKEAMASKQLSAVRDRLEKLDELVDKHLAFGRKSALREYTESIGIAVLVALLLRAFVVEAFKIPSGSMLPTLEVGDHIFVNKFIHGLRIPWSHFKFAEMRKPRRGEVIVFVYPQDESKDFIKRIVAVGGDTISVQKNVLIVNGKPVKRHQLSGPCSYPDGEEGSDRFEPRECVGWEEEQDGVRYRVIQDIHALVRDFPSAGAACPTGCICTHNACKVPEGHVFVMGDNRDNSHDSRFWGQVPYDLIKGKALIIWYSGVNISRIFKVVN